MLAADEAELRHKLYIDRITGDDRRFLQDMQDKIMCIFRLLSVQMFLSLSAKAGSLSTEEKEVLGVMLQGSKKKDEIGFSDRHLIDEIVRAYLSLLLIISQNWGKHGIEHRQGLEFLRTIVMHFMDELGRHDRPPAAAAASSSRGGDISPL